MMNKTFGFIAVVGLLTASIYFGMDYVERRFSPLPVYGEDSFQVPDFEFQNQMNETISSVNLKDKIWVVNFFFTSCPTICPKMTRNLQTLHEYLRDDNDVQFLSFTVDPKRDTSEKLKKYADSYRIDHEKWYFFTGDKKDLYRLGNRGFLLSASEVGGDETDFIHSENIVLVDTDQKIRGFYNGTDPKAMKILLNDINKLKRIKA